MASNLSIYTHSILNASMEQMDCFNELQQNAEQLKRLCKDGEQLCSGFINIIGDIWFAFYSTNTPMIENLNQRTIQHIELLEQFLAIEEFQHWRTFTQQDMFLSVLTTLMIAEQFIELLKHDEEVRKASIKRQLAEKRLEVAHSKFVDCSIQSTKHDSNLHQFQAMALQKMLKNATQEVMNYNVVALNKLGNNKQYLVRTISQSITIAKKRQDAIISLCTIDGRKIQQIPMREKLQITDAVIKNKKLIEIANLAGRFRKIAEKKMKMKSKFTMEHQAITFSNEINRLLSSELVNYIHPITKLDFLLRYAESKTAVYDKKGKDKRGKGPIIICMDESSSMNGILAESKAFCLALLYIAKKQKRDFAIIPFASDIGEIQYFLRGYSNSDAIMNYTQSFLGGGTNFEKPLRAALSILEKSQFNKADLLFVTDGSSFLPSSFIEEFKQIKKIKKFECFSIVLTNLINTVDLNLVSKFSDRVIEVHDLFEAEEVFSI